MVELRDRFEQGLVSAREILVEYGAHGDRRLAYRLDLLGERLMLGAEVGDRELHGAGAVTVALWTTFEDDTAA